MFHRKAEVVLAVCYSSYVRDGPFGNDFGDEDDTSSFLIVLLAADIKSQVYLIKITMTRNAKSAEKPCVAKLEAHKANVRPPIK